MAEDVTAAEIMSTPVRTIPEDATILEVARELREHHVGSLVVGEERLEGIVTESDIVTAVSREVSTDEPVTSVMSSPVVTARPSDTVAAVADRMGNNHVKKLPVTDEGEAVGIITTTDLARLLPDRRVTMTRHPQSDLSKGEFE
ncbi:CBS domain-containing protein [Halorarius litoreus]|uniref:CBS domain-containing protein n=1 Tax=Halorarius litoreus TaxID=2962676 RepID=UPI0020CBE97D|nr:CBS domain-containing protein [Halorarius litoreus]